MIYNYYYWGIKNEEMKTAMNSVNSKKFPLNYNSEKFYYYKFRRVFFIMTSLYSKSFFNSGKNRENSQDHFEVLKINEITDISIRTVF